MSQEQNTVKSKTITFLSPGRGKIPTGGSKVMYEYANGLADRGWRVRIIHPCTLTHGEIEAFRASILLRARHWMRYQRRKLIRDYRPDRWFKIRSNVDLLCTKTLEPRYVPPSDVWVATYWYTARWAVMYPGVRLYLIQHLETWCGPESDVLATWKMPLRKIVISRWLDDIAHTLGEPSSYIPNGLNFEAFGMDIPPGRRDPHTVAMLYHASDWKGSADGLKAIQLAKSKIPSLKAQIFGIPGRPRDLPDWIEYFQNPPQSRIRSIYNRAAVVVSPSWTEGWPLPPAEGLQCGSALAATDIGGHREYAIQGETALLSPPRNPDALAANLIHLLEVPELRIRLARQGHAHIQQFTWGRALDSFEAVVHQALANMDGNTKI